ARVVATSTKRVRLRKKRSNPVANIAGILFALVWLIPVYWMVNSAFQSESELMAWPPHLVPQQFTLDHFASVLANPSFWTALRASLIAAVITVAASTIAAILAAYALSRFKFRGRTAMVIAILVVQMIPAEA